MNVELTLRLEAELQNAEQSVQRIRTYIANDFEVNAGELAANAQNLSFHEGQVTILKRIIGQHKMEVVPPLVGDYIEANRLIGTVTFQSE